VQIILCTLWPYPFS